MSCWWRSDTEVRQRLNLKAENKTSEGRINVPSVSLTVLSVPAESPVLRLVAAGETLWEVQYHVTQLHCTVSEVLVRMKPSPGGEVGFSDQWLSESNKSLASY